MGSTRRTLLAAGVAAAATAAAPRVFAQQAGKPGAGKFYEKGSVRIYYEEAGSGFRRRLGHRPWWTPSCCPERCRSPWR